MDVITKRIKATEHLDLLLHEGTDDPTGCYIAIKHRERIRDLEGEVMIIPSDVPQLLQSLAVAAMELTAKGYYSLGSQDGAAQK